MVAESVQKRRDQIGGCLLFSLGLDENGRVDQEPQGRSSIGSPARTAIKSRPKASSSVIGVRLRRIFRHSDAFRDPTGGDVMRQTSRPRRRTTYVAPCSILSRSFENVRLVWVAETRPRRLSDLRTINLIIGTGAPNATGRTGPVIMPPSAPAASLRSARVAGA